MRIARVFFPRSGVGRQPGGEFVFPVEIYIPCLTISKCMIYNKQKGGIFPMKYKHFVSILLVFVMLCACLTDVIADTAHKTFTSGDYEYTLLDDGQPGQKPRHF